MSITSTEKKAPFHYVCPSGGSGTCGACGRLHDVVCPEKPPVTTNIASTRSDAIKGQAGGEGSDEYNKKLEAHDQQKANAALAVGESFIPTPVGGKSPVVTRQARHTPAPAYGCASPCRACADAAHRQHLAQAHDGRPCDLGRQTCQCVCGRRQDCVRQ